MITDPELIKKLTALFPFLSCGDEKFQTQFMQTAVLAQLDQGQSICNEGAQCEHLALVIDGTARVYKLGESGREITLYRISAGESCILTASCILSHQCFPAFAVTDEPVSAVVIPTQVVNRWMAESSVWRDYVFGLISNRLGDIISVVEEVAFKRVDRRIATYLFRQMENTSNAQITVTHQQIASDLGTSREVVSRILKDFESEKLIETTRGSIQITNARSLKTKTQEQ